MYQFCMSHLAPYKWYLHGNSIFITHMLTFCNTIRLKTHQARLPDSNYMHVHAVCHWVVVIGQYSQEI